MSSLCLLTLFLCFNIISCIEYRAPSERVQNFVTSFATFYSIPTPDPSKVPVIGYGHICKNEQCSDVTGFKKPLSESHAQTLLNQDLQEGILY